MKITRELVDQVMQLSVQASDAILSIYHNDHTFDVALKSDQSPVTAADLAAHQIITAGLSDITPTIPILSEEGGIASFAQRQSWSRYWLIDPLDGTKEFIHHNDEFTVNIALIEKHKPILGVVTVPVTGTVYWGGRGIGAAKMVPLGRELREIYHEQAIQARTIASQLEQQRAIEIVVSRHHGNDTMTSLTDTLSQHFPDVAYKKMGSALKLCLIAEGQADLYPRLAPSCEWDTAAAQAVVEAAGGIVVNDQLQRLDYNTKDSLLNPFFYVLGDAHYPWSSLL